MGKETQKNKTNIVLFAALFLVLISTALIYRLSSQNRELQLENYIQQKIITAPAKTGTKTELSQFYAIEYPDNFFITGKTQYSFSVADNKFLGSFTDIPEAGINVYSGVITKDTDLKNWLNGVNGSQLKPCIKDVFCQYLDISDVKDKSVDGIPAIEFQDRKDIKSNIHTIFKYKTMTGNYNLIDIYYSNTGLGDQISGTEKAYNYIVSTFKPLYPQ